MKQGHSITKAFIPEGLGVLAAYAPTDQRLNTEVFQIAGSITLPYERFQSGIREGMMYHCNPFDGGKATPECCRRDKVGDCKGHDMKRAEFIRKYCKGVEPRRLA